MAATQCPLCRLPWSSQAPAQLVVPHLLPLLLASFALMRLRPG